MLDPAVNGTMIDMQTPLQHDLFEVPITQRISQIPPHAQQNDVGLEVTPFEGILALVAHKWEPLLLVSVHSSRSAFYLRHCPQLYLRSGRMNQYVLIACWINSVAGQSHTISDILEERNEASNGGWA